jgi:hypothetical protein
MQNETYKSYYVMSLDSATEIQEAVNTWLGFGWELHGNLLVVNTHAGGSKIKWIQAMKHQQANQ